MVVLSIFFRKKIICQETIREFLSLHAPRSCMNTLIYIGIMFIICSVQIKIYREFYHGFIYIANEVKGVM